MELIRSEGNLDRLFFYQDSSGRRLKVLLGYRIQPVYLASRNTIRQNIQERFFVIDFSGIWLMKYESANFFHAQTRLYFQRNVGFESNTLRVRELGEDIRVLSRKKRQSSDEGKPRWPTLGFQVEKGAEKPVLWMEAAWIQQLESALHKALNWYTPPVNFAADRLSDREYQPLVSKAQPCEK